MPYQLATSMDVTPRISAASGALGQTLDLGHPWFS